LNGQNALWRRKDASFGAHCTNLDEDRPIHAATKMLANDSIVSGNIRYMQILAGVPVGGSLK